MYSYICMWVVVNNSKVTELGSPSISSESMKLRFYDLRFPDLASARPSDCSLVALLFRILWPYARYCAYSMNASSHEHVLHLTICRASLGTSDQCPLLGSTSHYQIKNSVSFNTLNNPEGFWYYHYLHFTSGETEAQEDDEVLFSRSQLLSGSGVTIWVKALWRCNLCSQSTLSIPSS